MRDGHQIAPKQVHFIISDLCNHDCHFCAYRMSNGFSIEQFAEDGNSNPNRKIPKEKCLELLDDMAEIGVRAIQFTGGGEPTVHPDHIEIFRHAQHLGLETSLVTNGSRLREGWEEVYSRMSWLRVSVDAGTAETYGHVRRIKPHRFQKTLQNIKAMSQRLQDSDCLLGVGYVLTRENWHELIEGCRVIKETGVPYVRLSGMFSTAGSKYYEGLDGDIRAAIKEAKRLYERNGFNIVDLYTDRLADLDQGSPDYEFCGYQQFVLYIGGNQKVYRCCTTSYTKHGELADLTNMRFRDWFRSKNKKEMIRQFDARSCQVCQFNNKNRTINYMLNSKPLHVNFV